VAESLARGKYCVASGTSSLPEIGGDLVDYHDPFDVPGALALIERAIYEPGWREAREHAIRAGFRTQSWRQCREEIEAALEPLFGAAPAPSNASH
jgi:hypothetical protein